MIPVSPIQLEHLHLAYQLLAHAGVASPGGAFLLGHFVPTGLESHLDSELEEHFIEHHGLDEETAKQSAAGIQVTDAVVQIPVTMDVLNTILGRGLLLDGDEGAVLLSNGETLPVTLSREMGVRVSLGGLSHLCLASDDISLTDYFRLKPEY